MDFQCLPALYHVAAVYQELGETDVELQALGLLYEVCLFSVLLLQASFLPSRPCKELQAGFCLLGGWFTLLFFQQWAGRSPLHLVRNPCSHLAVGCSKTSESQFVFSVAWEKRRCSSAREYHSFNKAASKEAFTRHIVAVRECC